jgi:hypothetical protein
MRTESCVAIAYTIRYGSENNTVPELFSGSVEPGFKPSGDGGSVSTTGGGRAGINPSDDVSIVKFSVTLGGPVRSL